MHNATIGKFLFTKQLVTGHIHSELIQNFAVQLYSKMPEQTIFQEDQVRVESLQELRHRIVATVKRITPEMLPNTWR